MRKILFFLMGFIFFIVILVGIVGAVIQTDWFWKVALPKMIHHVSDKCVVEKLNYTSKNIDWSGKILFKNLSVKFQYDQKYEFESSEFSIRNLTKIFDIHGGKISLKVLGFSLKTNDVMADRCSINILVNGVHLTLYDFTGDANCGTISVGQNTANDFSSKIQGRNDWLALEDIIFHFQQGTARGRMTMGLNDAMSYVLDLTFKDFLLDQNVFDGNVLGRVNGSLQASGFAKKLSGFEIILDAPQGAKIRAELLSNIMPNLPSRTTIKKDLERLISSGSYLYCETSHAVIKRVDDNKISAEIHLKAQKLNLIVNPTVDINIEGGLQSIFKMVEFFSNSQK